MERTSTAFALLTAAFVLGAQLAETAHVESEHVVCPEHGGLIHGGSGSGAAPSDADSVAGFESHEDHEAHCAQAFRAEHAASRAGLSTIVEAAPGLPGGSSQAAQPPIALLRLAPKSSPPVLA